MLPVLHRVHQLVPPKLHLVPPVPNMVLLQHQHRQWIKPRKLPIPLEKPVPKSVCRDEYYVSKLV